MNGGSLMYLGKFHTGLNAQGVLDEVRISDVSRSSGWIKTSYNNQISPSTFFDVVVEIQMDTSPPEITSVNAQPDPQETSGNVNITCNVNDNVEVDEVWINITYPDNSYHNETMQV